ncbi:MAG: universal stress protein [Sphingopyxis sp.]
MRSLLVYADGSPAMESRLQSALDLARAREGHVQLHINTPMQRYVTLDPFGGAFLVGETMQQAADEEKALVDRLAAQLAEEDVPWGIESSNSEPVDALISAARLADCIIVSLPEPGAVTTGPDVGALAVGARCPVLAVPCGSTGLRLNGTIMVAWDGSFEAAHALRAATPILALAGAVTLLTIAEKGKSAAFPATDALSYLSRYNIHAQLIEKERSQWTIEELLESSALELGADLVVLGAFGHSRFRETLFGGVTRYFIDSARFPLLLMH